MTMRCLTWGDLGGLFDGPHATPKRRDEGAYFLNISSLKSGRLDLSESDRVSEEDFEKWTRRVTPQEGDLLFSYETRLGEAALMPAGLKACLGRRMALLRPDPHVIDSRYLLYFFLSPQFQRLIDERSIVGATVPRVLLSTMPEWPIEIHPLHEQQVIVEVLGSLDERMMVNRRLVQQTDDMAKAVFESMSTQRTTPLSHTARFVNGKAFTKGASGSGRMVVRIAELNSGPGGSTVYNDIEVEDDYLARPGDLLFSWSGSLVVRRWFYPQAIVNQHIFKVIPKPGFPKWLVAQLISKQLEYFRGIAADKTTTMGHIQRRHLDEHVEVPSQAEIAKYDLLMTALWERALAAEKESRTLAALRDTLLPALMSGRLSVRQAEDMVSEVV